MQIPWQATDSSLDSHLAVAVLLSAVAHAVILMILGFTAEPPPEPSGPVMHMVEYQPKAATQSPTPDPGAKAASQSQAASGQGARDQEATSPQASRNARESAPPIPPAPPDPKPAEADPQPDPQPQADPKPQAKPEPRAEAPAAPPALTAPQAETTAPEPERDSAPSSAEAASPSESLQMFPSDQEVGQWDRQRQERKVASEEARAQEARAATREDAAAAYINSFLSKVQRIGNMNYPEEAQERDITGRVRVQAVVRADGSLATVQVLESSGSDILDAAAKQIIRMGAPYSRFPDELEGRYEDGLPIRHYFNFTRPADMASQARS